MESEKALADFQLRRALKLLLNLDSVGKKVANPYLFVRSAGNRTKAVWNFLKKARQADIRLAELEHPSLKKMLSFCSGRVPIYIHPCFYRSLKLPYSIDVGTAESRLSSALDPYPRRLPDRSPRE